MAIELVYDFTWATILLALGHIVWSKNQLLQSVHIPSAVIAGALGIFFGPEILGRFLPSCVSFSPLAGKGAMQLLGVVFCAQLLTSTFNQKIVGQALTTCVLNCGTACLQVFLGLGLCFFIGHSVPLGFGLMPFTGFYGGHGIPAVVAGVFRSNEYWSADIASSVGNTFATFGLLFGIMGGILVINLSGHRRCGNKEKTIPLQNTVRASASSLIGNWKQLAVQLCVVSGVMCVSHFLLNIASRFVKLKPDAITLSVIVVAGIVSAISRRTRLDRYLNHSLLRRIAGTAMNYLIVTSVATTKLSVFIDFGFELILLSVIILLATTLYVFAFGARWHKEYWLVNSLGTFGLATGVLTTGFLLIQIADPDSDTSAASNLAIGNSISTMTVQTFLLMVFPAIFVQFPVFSIFLVGFGFIFFTVAGTLMFRK